MLRILALIVIGCTLATACSKDELSESGSEELVGQKQQIQLTLRLQTSTGGLPTRSYTGEDGNAYDPNKPNEPGIENGTLDESKVTDALIVLGKISPGSFHPTEVHNAIHLTEFKQLGNIFEWSGMINEKPGKYRIVVIANPLPLLTGNIEKIKGANWEKFLTQKITLDNPDYIPAKWDGKQNQTTPNQNIWTDGRFMMTNYFDSNISEHEIDLLPIKNNYKDITVQRVCARFDYTSRYKDNVYSGVRNGTHWGGQQTPEITVKLEEVGLMNLSKSFYLMKMFAKDQNIETSMEITSHAKETNKNYVADTDWHLKKEFNLLTKEQLNGMFFFCSESKKSQGQVPQPTLEYRVLPTTTENTYQSLFYATENTIPGIPRQVNKLTTGVVFKGYFTVEGITAGVVYCYKGKNGNFHVTTDLNGVNKALGTSLSENATDAEFASKGIRKYKKEGEANGLSRFPVWYTYWNRHNDNGDPNKMGIMEFAVVRNNVYKLIVNSITMLGLPKDPTDPENPWKPDGNTPDEEWPDLDVVFKVQGWNERSFDYEI